MLYTNLILFSVSCVALSISGVYLVKSLINVSGFLRIREFAVAFILMAISTSLPELFVGITSALEQNSDIALGTALGSNIANIGLVFGIMLLIKGTLSIKSATVKKNSFYTLALILLPLLLMFDQELGRMDGILLLVVFLVYVINLIREEREFRAKEATVPIRTFMFAILIFILGFIALIVSAGAVVHFGKELAFDIGIPEIVVALLMISLGTSLPELVFEISAVHAKHEYMAIGDLFGSLAANSTLILGVAALIYPIKLAASSFFFSAIYLVFISLLFFYLVVRKQHITWKHGLVFLMLYIIYVISELIFCPACHV